MYLNKLLVKEFGKFNNREIDLKSGPNIIFGKAKSGKSTIRDFIVGMLYGMDVNIGLGGESEKYELRKPKTGKGFSGKAYIKKDGKSYLIERSFLKRNRRTSILDVQAGRDLRLKKENSLCGTIFDMDKNGYINSLCIEDTKSTTSLGISKELTQLIKGSETAATPDIDTKKAIENLYDERSKNDVRPIVKEMDCLQAEMKKYETIDEEIADIRRQIHEVEEEFAVEMAKRKREARRIVESENGESFEEDEAVNETLDELSKNSAFLDEEENQEPEEKITDKLWFIVLTGLFVIGVITAMVYILPFETGVRQLFVICTALFVVVTIVEGLYAKGVFDDDISTPSEEEFKRIIKELESGVAEEPDKKESKSKKKSSSEADESQEEAPDKEPEIDMTFATEYADKKAKLRYVEKDLLDKKVRKEELGQEYSVLDEKRAGIENEIKVIDYVISTITKLSSDIKDAAEQLVNGRISDIVSKLTNGRYNDVKVDEKYRILVQSEGGYVNLDSISFDSAKDIYLAVKISIAKVMSKEGLPVVVDDVFGNYDSDKIGRILECLTLIDTEQLVITTSNPAVQDIVKLNTEYNIVEL